jgi:hypothetical protein
MPIDPDAAQLALAEGLDGGAEVVLDLVGVLAVERQTEDVGTCEPMMS